MFLNNYLKILINIIGFKNFLKTIFVLLHFFKVFQINQVNKNINCPYKQFFSYKQN